MAPFSAMNRSRRAPASESVTRRERRRNGAGGWWLVRRYAAVLFDGQLPQASLFGFSQAGAEEEELL